MRDHPADVNVTLTEDGYLRIDQAIARRFFPEDTLVVFRRDQQVLLMPTRGAASGGLILKQRNAAGDRAVLLTEQFAFQQIPAGTYAARWASDLGALIFECNSDWSLNHAAAHPDEAGVGSRSIASSTGQHH